MQFEHIPNFSPKQLNIIYIVWWDLYENMSSFQVHNIFLNVLKLPNSYEESM